MRVQNPKTPKPQNPKTPKPHTKNPKPRRGNKGRKSRQGMNEAKIVTYCALKRCILKNSQNRTESLVVRLGCSPYINTFSNILIAEEKGRSVISTTI